LAEERIKFMDLAIETLEKELKMGLLSENERTELRLFLGA
jgi:hypothetical protein